VSLSSLLLFAGVYFAAVATPGPGVAALVARVMAHGLKGVAAVIAGFVAGDMLWLVFTSTGLTVLAREFAGVLTAVKFAGAAYLLYVAWSLLRIPAGFNPDATPPMPTTTGARAFLGAFSLTVSNPKVIVFFLSILPLVLDLGQLEIRNLFIVAGLAAFLQTSIFLSYALAANRVRGWLVAPPAVKWIRRATAGLMAGVAVAIVTR
jgi:threonine/homoserine/homoserine lactone efflux protein